LVSLDVFSYAKPILKKYADGILGLFFRQFGRNRLILASFYDKMA